MNIFAVSYNQTIAAKFLDDKRLIKMILETAQLLSTAILISKYPDQSKEFLREKATELDIYRPTHINHPITKWVRKSLGNYRWTVVYLEKLLDEYTVRYKKTHKVSSKLNKFIQMGFYCNLPNTSVDKFCNCAKNSDLGLDFTNIENVPEAYQQYLFKRWENDKYPARCKIGK